MNFIKDAHLSAAVRLFFSDRFDLASFPYKEAYDAWRRGAGKRGRYQLGNHGRV